MLAAHTVHIYMTRDGNLWPRPFSGEADIVSEDERTGTITTAGRPWLSGLLRPFAPRLCGTYSWLGLQGISSAGGNN